MPSRSGRGACRERHERGRGMRCPRDAGPVARRGIRCRCRGRVHDVRSRRWTAQAQSRTTGVARRGPCASGAPGRAASRKAIACGAQAMTASGPGSSRLRGSRHLPVCCATACGMPHHVQPRLNACVPHALSGKEGLAFGATGRERQRHRSPLRPDKTGAIDASRHGPNARRIPRFVPEASRSRACAYLRERRCVAASEPWRQRRRLAAREAGLV